MKEMASILHDDILISAQKVPLFKIRVVDDLVMLSQTNHKADSPTDAGSTAVNCDADEDEGSFYLDSEVDLPLYSLAVEQAINLCTMSMADSASTVGKSDSSENSSGGPPTHVKFVLEWDAPAKSQIIADDDDIIEDHSSVKEVENSPVEATTVSLQECFDLYTKAETLGQGNAWFCDACNQKQEVVKRMGLWSVPDVLVIHLKRFRQSMGSVQGGGHMVNGDLNNSGGSGSVGVSGTASKLSTMVEFPLERFDMSPNVSDRPNKPKVVDKVTISTRSTKGKS